MCSIMKSKEGNSRKGWLDSVNYLKRPKKVKSGNGCGSVRMVTSDIKRQQAREWELIQSSLFMNNG